ncbi:MAG: PfkB family carbohydrate kinase, partial [Cyanobacteria bacterium]|nr:PfkB family carbohydrate kinase [Cyanobacteriota bacterium]MDW8203152.1 PfkB family carbohydrate kinase [Cyanobacteriota bacterium SKYGB_h_bin112]
NNDVVAYLRTLAVPHIAITNGADPIQFYTNALAGTIPVPVVAVVDTLGAGDIFHGAFCHYILSADFTTALQKAATIASSTCTSFGTRQWLLSSIPE